MEITEQVSVGQGWSIPSWCNKAAHVANPVVRIFGAIGVGNFLSETVAPSLPMFNTPVRLTGTLIWGVGKLALTALYLLPFRTFYIGAQQAIKQGFPVGQVSVRAKHALQSLVNDTSRHTKALLGVTAIYFAASCVGMTDLSLPWVGSLLPGLCPFSMQTVAEYGTLLCGATWLSSWLLSKQAGKSFAVLGQISSDDWSKTWTQFAITNGHLAPSGESSDKIKSVAAAYALAYLDTDALAITLGIRTPSRGLFSSSPPSKQYTALESAQKQMKQSLIERTVDFDHLPDAAQKYVGKLEHKLSDSVGQYQRYVSQHADRQGQFFSVIGV